MTGNFLPPGDRLSEQQRAGNRTCMRTHREYWVVTMRNYNASAFNGYRPQWSAYSEVRCTLPGCEHPPWRTKADYVRGLPDARRQQ